MKTFALDERGDLLIENGEIQMITESDVTAQKIKTVLGIQKGEWFFNEDEGINRDAILGKKKFVQQANSKTTEKTKLVYTENPETQELNEMLERRLDGETDGNS